MREPVVESNPHWLIVVELDDVVPRRDPSKPNLYVAKTLVPPSKRAKALEVSRRKTWYQGHIIKFRRDLTPVHQFADAESAADGYQKLRDKLLADGFTVNRNERTWRVYVLDLDQSKLKDPGEGFLYVGQTAVDIETRFEQHLGELSKKSGKSLSAPSLKKQVILGINWKLTPEITYFTEEQSKIAEAQLADELRNQGFKVLGGH